VLYTVVRKPVSGLLLRKKLGIIQKKQKLNWKFLKMSKVRNIGMTSIVVGPLGADGGLSTSMTALGRTYRETASITQEDNTKQDFLVEEQDDPVESIVTQKGVTNIVWDVVDFDPLGMQRIWGGEVINDTWHEPEELPTIEMSVKLTPKIGRAFIYPRCSLSAILVYNATRTDIARIRITARKLKPEKEGLSAFIWGEATP
jgi:hypothetical protein